MRSNVKIRGSGFWRQCGLPEFSFLFFEPDRNRGSVCPLLRNYNGNVKNIMYKFKMIQNNTFKSLVTSTVMSIVTSVILHNFAVIAILFVEKVQNTLYRTLNWLTELKEERLIAVKIRHLGGKQTTKRNKNFPKIKSQ